ncbi:MAG: autotransporter domain-containing protein [Opitutae bacterium]|nr:autotransporter domain-containing protein [Opitutae bacterium]
MNDLRSRILAGLAALGLTATALAQSVPANRTFSNYYFFGDSLTDSGNTFALTGSPPAPYFAGRVSNGITYAEYLAPGLAAAATTSSNAAKLNFAFAGATAATGSAVPNLSQQVAMYQARGITANANGLYVLLAGANDLLNAVQVPANQNANAMTNTAIAASTAVANAVQSLAGLGAKNILVLNLPDISKTPRFTTGSGASAASLMQTASYAFNGDIKTRIAGLSSLSGVNVTVFDLGSIFQTIVNNPQTFGFSIANQDPIDIMTAGGNPGDISRYVFWDGIHPTTKTHALFAAVLTEVLNPEFVLGTFAARGTTALVATDLSADSLQSRLDASRLGVARHQADGFVSFSSKSGSFKAAGYQAGFDYSGNAVTAGFDYSLASNLLVGLAVSAENLETDLDGAAGSSVMRGQMVTAFAQWKSGSFFADGSVGVGTQDFKDVKRTTALGGMATTAKSDGDRTAAHVRVGWDLVSDAWRFTPFAGLRYAKAKLDGYTESGVPGLNFVFGGQNAKSFDAQLGANVDYTVRFNEQPFVLSGTAVYQKDVNENTRSLSGRLADTVAATGTTTVDDGLGETFKLGARVSGAVSKNWGWSVGYLADFRKNGETANQYSLSLHTGF